MVWSTGPLNAAADRGEHFRRQVSDRTPERAEIVERAPDTARMRVQLEVWSLRLARVVRGALGTTDDLGARWSEGAVHIEPGERAFLAGDLLEARHEHEAALEIARALLAEHPWSVEPRQYVAVALLKLGEAEARTGNLAAARELFQRALEAREVVAKMDPDSTQAQLALAEPVVDLGGVEQAVGNLEEARELWQRALTVRGALGWSRGVRS